MSYLNKITAQFDPSNMSAFGTLESSEITPVIQGDWVYGINTQIWNTPVISGTGATVDTSSSRLRIQSGTNSAGYAYITSKKAVKYRAGQGVILRITPLFTAGVVNNIQLWGVGTISGSDPYDGYFFGYNGTSLGLARYTAGTPTWYPQTAWNGDKVDGSVGTSFNWNPTFGTPAMIKYPYLGFGDIEFFLQNPANGRWVLIHTIQYANTVNTTQLANPSLQVVGYTKNSGNTTNQIMYSGSVGAFISGVRIYTSSPKWAMDSVKSAISAEACMINLKNCTTFNGVTNRGVIRLHSVSVGSASNTNAVLRFKIGATIGGSPSYTPINGSTSDAGVTITGGHSITSYDTAGTTVSAGSYIYNVSIGSNDTSIIDLTPFDILINPAEILTISLFGSANTNASVSVNWSEEI